MLIQLLNYHFLFLFVILRNHILNKRFKIFFIFDFIQSYFKVLKNIFLIILTLCQSVNYLFIILTLNTFLLLFN
jgi:hypothetical protein